MYAYVRVFLISFTAHCIHVVLKDLSTIGTVKIWKQQHAYVHIVLYTKYIFISNNQYNFVKIINNKYLFPTSRQCLDDNKRHTYICLLSRDIKFTFLMEKNTWILRNTFEYVDNINWFGSSYQIRIKKIEIRVFSWSIDWLSHTLHQMYV